MIILSTDDLFFWIFSYVCTKKTDVPDPSPRRPQQRSVETRHKLVEAALQEFSERGFEGATTRAIVDRAGVALAALPYHFKTKDALWRAAAIHIFTHFNDRFANRIEGLEGVDEPTRLRLLLADYVRFAASHPELHRFMEDASREKSERLNWLVETQVRPMYDTVSALTRNTPTLKAWHPGHLLYAMIGTVATVYAHAPEFELLTGERPDRKRLIDAHVELLVRLFLPEPEPAPGPPGEAAG
jgi:TetR/AcrR family transcriptional regulator